MLAAAIEISGLSKVYRKRGGESLTAVNNLNLSVPTGQVLGFLGSNGAGKTTTIKMICGLIVPSAGNVCLNGFDVGRKRSRAVLQMGAVLEGTRNIYWRLSPWENLAYFARLKGQTGKAVNARAESLLRELDLWDRRHDAVGNFSRGMQQKVAIACALIADPPIVLLDEPTLGLDVQAAHTVKKWIAKLSREQGKTLVLTTHQLDMAEELCDRVAIMNKGKLIADEPTTKLLNLFRQEHYEIKIRGQVDEQALALPAGFTRTEDDGVITLSGPITDQPTLYSILDGMRDKGLALVSVARTEPKLEEIFVRLTGGN